MYQYKMFSAYVMGYYCQGVKPAPEDSAAKEHAAIERALEDGYRWIRTEDNIAILEKSTDASGILNRMFSLLKQVNEITNDHWVVSFRDNRSGYLKSHVTDELLNFATIAEAIYWLSRIVEDRKKE